MSLLNLNSTFMACLISMNYHKENLTYLPSVLCVFVCLCACVHTQLTVQEKLLF